MQQKVQMNVIAHIQNGFKSKFAIPRQSGLETQTVSRIVFEKQYRDENALRGIDGFSHLWLIWYFSQAEAQGWSPTVRPPRLGGNKRMGVFSTRSPFRPNRIGLSSVKLCGVEKTERFGTVLKVTGADLMDGTPILDIKPYLSFTDCHENAVCGFADETYGYELKVNFPPEIKETLPTKAVSALEKILKQDPRPSYHSDADRIYGFEYGNYSVKFKVEGDILSVVSVSEI